VITGFLSKGDGTMRNNKMNASRLAIGLAVAAALAGCAVAPNPMKESDHAERSRQDVQRLAEAAEPVSEARAVAAESRAAPEEQASPQPSAEAPGARPDPAAVEAAVRLLEQPASSAVSSGG